MRSSEGAAVSAFDAGLAAAANAHAMTAAAIDAENAGAP